MVFGSQNHRVINSAFVRVEVGTGSYILKIRLRNDNDRIDIMFKDFGNRLKIFVS